MPSCIGPEPLTTIRHHAFLISWPLCILFRTEKVEDLGGCGGETPERIPDPATWLRSRWFSSSWATHPLEARHLKTALIMADRAFCLTCGFLHLNATSQVVYCLDLAKPFFELLRCAWRGLIFLAEGRLVDFH